jgi:glycosyltransferase involved in cell wall biosynthesis
MIEIIIITFNRASSLSRTLNAISESELNAFSITILDNCSTDDTQDIIGKILVTGALDIRYIRNPINIGGSANIMRAYEIASEKYVWLICDDDEYDFGKCAEALRVLNDDHPDVLVVGRTNKQSSVQLYSNRVGKLLSANEYRDTELSKQLTFLPSAIINTVKLKECDFSLGYELSHTFFPQFFWISQLYNKNWSVYVMPSLMITRPPIGHGLASNFTHLNGFLRGAEQFNKMQDVENARNMYFGRGYITYALFIAKLMMVAKISGELTMRDYLNHLVLINPVRRLICAVFCIIFLVPTSVLSALRAVKKSMQSE